MSPAPAPTPQQRLAAARQRLEASRGHLINVLDPRPPDDGGRRPCASGPAPSGHHGGWSRLARSLLRRWWRRQPWHRPAALLAGTALRQARPLVRRHPWAALAAAAAAGAVVTMAVPWLLRGPGGPAARLRRRMGGPVGALLGSLPVQAALAGLLADWLQRQGAGPSPAPSPPAPSPSPAGREPPLSGSGRS